MMTTNKPTNTKAPAATSASVETPTGAFVRESNTASATEPIRTLAFRREKKEFIGGESSLIDGAASRWSGGGRLVVLCLFRLVGCSFFFLCVYGGVGGLLRTCLFVYVCVDKKKS